MNKITMQKKYLKYTVPLLATMTFASLAADISDLSSGKNGNGEYEIQIIGSDLKGIKSYSMNNPARIVLDIPNARSHLKKKIVNIKHPGVSSVAVIEGDDRVRATVNLSKMLPFEVVKSDSRITIVIKNANAPTNIAPKSKKQRYSSVANTSFELGSKGQGKVKIRLPNGKTSVDVKKQGKSVVARISGATFGQTKRLNVIDFGTPVKSIDILRNSLSITPINGDYNIVSYQSENVFWIEFNKAVKNKEEIDQAKLLPGDSRRKYTGDPLSLNFQDIGVRAVLQLIGDFTGTNVVVSDSVAGSITLRLNDVPWDQALDIILQTKGLSMTRNGDVISIAPAAEIAAHKKAALGIISVEENFGQLRQELIQVQYARAEELLVVIQNNSTQSTGPKGATSKGAGLLSARGSISVDARTNSLIINDVGSGIEKVRELISKLDVAVDQVLIDARIVTATSNFARGLGMQFGASANQGASSHFSSESILDSRLGVRGSTGTGSFGLSLLSKDFEIDLELQAMQDEGTGEIVSSPRVIAQDGREATIKQGTSIAYATTDKDGEQTVTWKEIPLMLKVKPKIAPDNRIDMELNITKNTPGKVFNGEQGIDTNNISTQVLVDNGETVVLGGVYEQQKSHNITRVPGLSSLPIVGTAFTKTYNGISKSELLIFVTPKIIDNRYTAKDKFADLRN